jgi:SAM-dependent methyltransferase
MTEHDVHEQVSRAYEKALELSRQGGGGCCGGAKAPASHAAALAGYGAETARYAETAASSFGCGNPLALSGVGRGQTVLDLGSGAGLDLLIAADRVGAEGRVLGVDMTDAMVAASREAARRAGHANVEVRKGRIEHLPVEDASVDWVISNCVVNLSPDKPAVFAEIARVLKPGGRLSISDIVAEDLDAALRASAEAYAACIGGAISEAEYVRGLEGAGLVEVEVAERLVYDAQQLSALVGADLEGPGGDARTLEAATAKAAGKVWSARFTARKPN